MTSLEREPDPIPKTAEIAARAHFTNSPENEKVIRGVIEGTIILSEETLPDNELREALVIALIDECTSLEELERRLIQVQFVFEQEKISQAVEMLPVLKQADDTGQVTESFLDMWFTNDYGLRDTLKRLLL